MITNYCYLTNEDNIRELARALIQCVSEPEYDYNYEEELEYIGEDNYYQTSDREIFDMNEYSSAIEHEVKWLMSERKE